MSPESLVRKPSFGRKVLFNLAVITATSVAAIFSLVCIQSARAQGAAPASAPNPAQDLSATWQGTLHAGQDLRIVLKISKADAGGYKADFYSIDQGGQALPVDKITVDGGSVKMSLKLIGGTYDGKLSADGKSIQGNWTQGPNPLALNFARATPETEWSIPTPPPPVPPMAADANPSFDVATIKPSAPDAKGKGFGFRGGHFVTFNTNVNDLIAFAYGLHAKQIVGGPDWFGVDLFDIEAKPDAEGRPSLKQMGIMVQKLLTERFKLTFHHDQRELSVYVISVAGGGPKMTKSATAPNDPQGFQFRGLGDLIVRNMTMKDFASWMQSGVMDRPVVDQTGLTDRYDFTLKWTPDDSQFAQFRGAGVSVPPPTDDPKAPPSLYTAITEQIGLKMGPAKAPDDVVVIDHVEKPSAN
ncbi:MAG: TIGR03435 family protein [Terracidiphilus sp.]